MEEFNVEKTRTQMRKGILEMCILSVIDKSKEAYVSDLIETMKNADMIVVEGTLYPLLADTLNLGKISVGAPYYNRLIVPLALASLILLAVGPLLRWQRDRARRLLPRLAIMMTAAALATLAICHAADAWQWRPITAVACATFAASAIPLDYLDRLRHRIPASRPYHGMQLAHLGYIVLALAITAAITYTVGRCAYGYHALGEISVFIFFGLLGVLGSYYLQSGGWHPTLFLPAAGSGLLAAAVLNINNIRDITSDRSAGKQTLAVKLGFERAKTLQYTLLVAASCCYLTYALLNQAYTSLLWLLLLPLVSTHARALHRAADQMTAGEELKRIVGCACGVNLLFSLGLCL